MIETNYGGTNYQKIIRYVDLVINSPKKDVKFFYFDDGKKFIVDGNRLKLLPFDFHKLYTKSEFYVHINPIEKIVMYYAYDIVDYISGKHINEEEGFMDWKDVEECIYNFFVINIKQLTDTIAPYTEVQESKSTQSSSSSSWHNPNPPQQYGYPVYSAYNGYGTVVYKEREAFFDKLWALLKENKTSHAMDLISAHIKKMCEDNKFEDLNTLLHVISFDKLNIPTMLGILDATNSNCDSIKARKDFLDKVKTHFTKINIKPARAERMLRNFISAKEVDAKQEIDASKSV